MNTIFFHIDVNSAFLSWSAQKRLLEGDGIDLRTIPSIVGGDRQRRHGVVLAKSVPAKKYGILTGEPIVNALRKFESAGVIESRSSGMKGTYIKVLNDVIFDELKNIKNTGK